MTFEMGNLKALLLPGVIALVMLYVLISLGNWQMERLAWKRGLITKIETRVKKTPVSLAKAEAIGHRTGDIEYLRVVARGRFMHDKERYYYAPSPQGSGWHVYTPLMIGKNRLLMVNRGFVPDAMKDRATRSKGLPSSVVEIVGLLREPGEKNAFTPKNELENNIWYWRDLSNMVASVVDKTKVGAYPFFLEIEAHKVLQPSTNTTNSVLVKPKTDDYPRPGATRLTINNNHLEYAVTWYGLALTLIGVFLAFGWSSLRRVESVDNTQI